MFDTEEGDEEILEIILKFEKTACFGKCPVYSVLIFSNGTVSYEGRANVDKIGIFESFVNDSFVFTVFQEAEKIDFFNLKKQYPNGDDQIPDLPKTITFLKKGKKELEIVNTYEAPQALLEFENFFGE